MALTQLCKERMKSDIQFTERKKFDIRPGSCRENKKLRRQPIKIPTTANIKD